MRYWDNGSLHAKLVVDALSHGLACQDTVKEVETDESRILFKFSDTTL